jgi:hypothetical protein
MAHGLSFLFEVRTGIAKTSDAGASLVEGFTPGANSSPDILHYVWAVDVPNPNQPPNTKTVLLTTVYDEQFEPYIRDLVLANPTPFNLAAKIIIGMEGFIPVESPTNLPKFIEFVREHDLTHGGTTPFTEAYPYTVTQIKACFASN